MTIRSEQFDPYTTFSLLMGPIPGFEGDGRYTALVVVDKASAGLMRRWRPSWFRRAVRLGAQSE